MQNLRNKTRQKHSHRYKEQTEGCRGGCVGEKLKGTEKYKPVVMKEISHRNVMYNTENVVNTIIITGHR